MFGRIIRAVALLTASATLAVAQVRDFKPVTDEVLANPDPGDWLMLNRTFDQQRFSPLKDINKSNVGQLRMAWSRGLPAGTQESVPIVYRGIMYLFAPGATIQAVDATNGDLIWEYAREYPQGVNPRAARNKSLGIYEDMIYFAAPDGVLLALDWKAESSGLGKGGTGMLSVDGKEVARKSMEHTTPVTFPEDETFDIGQDTRTGVALLEHRYDVPFKFTGKINKLTFKLEAEQDAQAKR